MLSKKSLSEFQLGPNRKLNHMLHGSDDQKDNIFEFEQPESQFERDSHHKINL